MLKKYIALILLMLFLFTGDLIAQPGNGNGGPPCGTPPCGPPPPPDTPIDGGIGFLLVLGAGYAVKKIRDNK